jgi:hypothetical protein
VKKLFLVAISLVLLNPAQLYAGDKEDLIKQIKQGWVNTSNKTVDMSTRHPDGFWRATSEGGLWEFQTLKEEQSQAETNKNTFNMTPHHIEVTLLGKNKDVAYTNHYAVGKITGPDGKVIVENYRTRVSETYVKENGKWKVIGNHYSPLYGGSGVISDLD